MDPPTRMRASCACLSSTAARNDAPGDVDDAVFEYVEACMSAVETQRLKDRADRARSRTAGKGWADRVQT